MRAFAIYPSPMEENNAFADAGFTDFADTDERWEAEWQGLVTRVVARGRTLGGLSFAWPPGNTPMVSPLVRAPSQGLAVDALVDASIGRGAGKWDEVCVDFGAPTRMRVLAGAGHAILWVALPEADAVDPVAWVDDVASGSLVLPRQLKWSALGL